MTHDNQARRVAVIGAGPGGLAASMLLSRAGADVTVFERLPRVGGRSATIDGASDVGRFRFDMGPTFFLYPRVLEDVFAACGLDLHEEVELIRLDPQYRLVFEQGGRIDATSDLQRLAAEIARFSPADAAALPAFMAENRRKLSLFRPVLERPFNSLLTFLNPAVLRAAMMMRPHRSVDRDLATHFSDERVRLAFSFQSKYLGMSPFRCPSLFTILSFMEYEYGVWHPRGGCGAVMEAMARAARRLGATIKLAEPVEQILFRGRRATGVRAGGVDHAFDAVVVNADFAHAIRALIPDRLRRRWRDRHLASKKFSCSTFMLYLGIEGEIPDLSHHTIFFAEDYERNVAEIEAGLVAPDKPSFYVQNACVTDKSLAPPGHSTLYVLVPVGNATQRGISWNEIRQHYRRLVLDRLQLIGIPDLDRRIRFEKMLTPPDWASDLAIHRGATFNLAHSLDQMLHRRPHNRFEDVDGVYLVGGGTHPGSGLPVIFESARITAKLLAQDLGLKPSWTTTLAMPATHHEEREAMMAEAQ